MGKKNILKVLFILCVLIIAVSAVSPAYAVTSLPDSNPTTEFYVYRNLLETGDWLLIINQNIPYAVPPADPVSTTYLWRMFATDNVTEFGVATSYPWNDNGYNESITSMYFSAADATAKGIVWGTAYTIRLSGNPLAFVSPPEYNFTLSAADYSIMTVTADVQTELAARILTLANDFDIAWAWGATYSLLNETETGTVLSIYGEAFFRGAIYGLQGLCPPVFAYIVNDLDLTSRTWSETYVGTLNNQYSGTWVNTAKAAGAALFGTTYDLTALIVSLLVAAALGIATIVLSGDAFHGLCDARTGLIVMTRLGFMDLGSLGLLASLAVIYGAIRAWGVMK
jgi:hypothetical protein